MVPVYCVCVDLSRLWSGAMADINYNEATHSIVYTQDGASVCPGQDPMFHWDVRFPERLSRLHLTSDLSRVHAGTCLSPLGRRQQRRARADRSAAAGRYRTQPITFDEIAEVDEDGSNPAGQPSTAGDEAVSSAATAAGVTGGDAATSKESKVSFMQQMSGFSRSMDGLVSGYVQRAAAGAVLTGSDKENTPCDADAKPTPGGAGGGAVVAAAGSADRAGSGEARVSPGSDDVTSAAAMMGFQMPAISDISRHRRKRSNRKLRNRNSVPEEVIPERGDDANVSS